MNCKLLFTFILTSSLFLTYGKNKERTYLFVGTYTDGKPNTGIFVYEFNPTSGRLKEVSKVENLTNPSFLTISPNGRYLYACTDTKLPMHGSVTAFSIDSTNGKLSGINKQSSGGENPIYLTTSGNNKFVVNGNYGAGNVSVFTTNDNGSLNPYAQIIQFKDSSINKARQEKSHIHSTVFSPNNDYIFLPDLGADKIRVFKFDTTNVVPLIAADNYLVNTIPGSGPRHFTFHPNGKFAYCMEELSGMVSAYNYNNGKLDSIQRIFSYSKILDTYSGADIHISPDGRFLYASNRLEEENTIAIFSIDRKNGTLTLMAHQKTYGNTPRNFTINPSGEFLLVANQSSNNIIVFKRNIKTGLLTKTGKEIKVSRPSCLQMRTYN